MLSQRLQTLAQIVVDGELRGLAKTSIYQSMMPEATEMHVRGVRVRAICQPLRRSDPEGFGHRQGSRSTTAHQPGRRGPAG